MTIGKPFFRAYTTTIPPRKELGIRSAFGAPRPIAALPGWLDRPHIMIVEVLVNIRLFHPVTVSYLNRFQGA